MLMSTSWIMMKRKRRRSCCRGRGWRMRRRGWSCGRGSAACPGWAPASLPAVSTAARPPQSRITSSAQSVGKSKDSHNTDWLNENDEQIAIACLGMADVDIPIILGISKEVWYLNIYLLVTQRMRMGSSAADSRLHTAATTATSWPGSLNTNSQPSTQQNVGWNTKSILTMFCIIIIFEPYHFVLLLQAEDTGLQFSNSVWSSHGLFSVGRKHKMFWLATITTSQLLFILLFVIWNTVIHHCILLRLRLFLAFESHLWCLTTHNNNPPHFTTYKKQVTYFQLTFFLWCFWTKDDYKISYLLF